MSSIIRRRWEQSIVKKKNDLSIATILKCGELSLLFSGDIENQTIQHIPSHYFEDITYIKVPHYTSKISTKLIDKINESPYTPIPTTITTTYKQHNLPDHELIREYKKITSNFYSSGNEEQGYIKTIYNVLKRKLFLKNVMEMPTCVKKYIIHLINL